MAVALPLMAAGTASDPYLNVSKYATIDEAGAAVDGMETIYKYTEAPGGYWLTVSNYGLMKTDATQNWFENTMTDADTGTQYTNAWTATDIFPGPSAYFGDNAAYSVKYKQPTKTQTFYVTFCTQVKQYAYHRSNASYYIFKMEIYECEQNADGTLTGGTTLIETLTNQNIGAEVMTSNELDPEKIYKVVIYNSYSYLYEIAFKTPGAFDGEITTPVAYEATGIDQEAVTLHWSPCPGVKSYSARIYPTTPTGLIFRENFSHFTASDEVADWQNIDQYTDNPGWLGWKLHGADGGVVVDQGGYISTPDGYVAYPYLTNFTIKFKAKSYGDDTGCKLGVQGGGQNLTFDLTPEEKEYTILCDKPYDTNASVWFSFFNNSDADENPHRIVLTSYKAYLGDFSQPRSADAHSPKWVKPEWVGDTTFFHNIPADSTMIHLGYYYDGMGNQHIDFAFFNYTNACYAYQVKSVYYDGQESEWSNIINYVYGTWPTFISDDDEPGTPVAGDVNGDGEVNTVDITILYNYLLNNDTEGMVNGDQDGDGSITAVDITVVYNTLLGAK